MLRMIFGKVVCWRTRRPRGVLNILADMDGFSLSLLTGSTFCLVEQWVSLQHCRWHRGKNKVWTLKMLLIGSFSTADLVLVLWICSSCDAYAFRITSSLWERRTSANSCFHEVLLKLAYVLFSRQHHRWHSRSCRQRGDSPSLS